MAALTPEQTALIEEMLGTMQQTPPAFPSVPEFRVEHADQRAVIDDLLRIGALSANGGYYVPTLAGLRSSGTASARRVIQICNQFLGRLKELVRREPRKQSWSAAEISHAPSLTESDAKLALAMLVPSNERRIAQGWSGQAPFFDSILPGLDAVLDAEPLPEIEPAPITITEGPASIRRLYIHAFRSFVNFEWRPPLACVLVGENGAGKSALLEVLWLIQDLVAEGKAIHETMAPSARTNWLDTPEQIVEIELETSGESFRYRLAINWDGGAGAISEELHCARGLLYRASAARVELFGDNPARGAQAAIPFDRRLSFMAALEPQPDNRLIIAFREAIRRIVALKPDLPRISGGAPAETDKLLRDLSNFAGWYLPRVAEDPDATAQLHEDLRAALVGFSSLRFVPVSPELKGLRIRFVFGKQQYELPWSELSDGQRYIIVLYAVLRFGLSRASLIVLDEADNYIAPGEIQPWLRAVVDSAATRKQQLLVVSHNREAIDYVAADGAWRMWRDSSSGHTRIAPLAPDMEAGETAYEAARSQSVPPPNGAGVPHE